MPKPRLLRITTVPQSILLLLNGQLNFMMENDFEVLSASSDGPEVELLRLQGIRHESVLLTRRITPLRDLIGLFQIMRTIRKFKPDIVHTHTPKAGLIGMMAAWFCRVPVRMHTVAGLPLMETSGSKRLLLSLAEKLTAACATRIYPNSAGLQHFLATELGFPQVHMKILGHGSSNGIDVGYFRNTPDIRLEAEAIRKKYAISDAQPILCFIGRVVRDKGVVELVQAFKKLDKLNAKLLIIGPLEQDLNPLPEDVLSFLQGSDRVILAGFQKDIRPWLAASTVFVFPSYREGFPNVVMQAACMELPCIVSDINGCNEIISHGTSGLIVPVKDADQLAQAISSTLANRERAREFAAKAREKVISQFEQKYVWKEILDEYRHWLGIGPV